MGEDVQRVADRYALDERGLRRFIRAGDELPSGWRWEESAPEPEPEPTPKAKAKARRSS